MLSSIDGRGLPDKEPLRHCVMGQEGQRMGKREEWLIAEVNRLRTVVAEVTLENLTLKRGVLV